MIIDLSVVVPTYNEEECLVELYRRLSSTLSSIVSHYEIIFVDDGSVDATWSLILELTKNDNRVKAVQFSRNFGHHTAITAGLDHSVGNHVVIMDSDLQDRPEEIPKLYQEALTGYDIVLARRKNKKHGKIKRTMSKLFHRLISRLSAVEFDSEVGVFRLVSRKAVNEICRLKEASRFFSGLVQWVGFKTSFIDVEHGERFAGETKYPLSRQISLALEAMLSFTDKPLKLSIYIGVLLSVIGFIYGTYIVIKAFMGGIAVLGYASLMSVLLFVSGVIICTVGITGLYVGRIFREVKQRPLYIVNERVNFSTNTEKSIS